MGTPLVIWQARSWVELSKYVEFVERGDAVEENVDNQQDDAVRLRQSPPVHVGRHEKEDDSRQQCQCWIRQTWNDICEHLNVRLVDIA